MAVKTLYFILSENRIVIGSSEGTHAREICRYDFAQKTEFYYKEQLERLLETYQLKTPEYEEHVLAWYTTVNTMVPNNILEDSKPEALLKYGCKENNIKFDTDYNRIAEYATVNIYEIPLWVKSFFVIRFPRIVIAHLGTGILKGIADLNTFKNEMFVFPMLDRALMVYVQRGEIQLYNHFEYANNKDLIYYLLNILKQTSSMDERGVIHLYGDDIFFLDFQSVWKELKLSQQYILENNSVQIFNLLSACVS